MMIAAFLTSKLGIGLAAGLAIVAALLAAHHMGVSSGRSELLAEQARTAITNERERIKDDARLSRLSDHDLCSRGLRARGLPDDACSSTGAAAVASSYTGFLNGISPTYLLLGFGAVLLLATVAFGAWWTFRKTFLSPPNASG